MKLAVRHVQRFQGPGNPKAGPLSRRDHPGAPTGPPLVLDGQRPGDGDRVEPSTRRGHVGIVAALLLPLVMAAGCHKHQAQAQAPLAPPIIDAPPQKPDTAPANLPPPEITPPQPAAPAPATQTTADNAAPPKPKPTQHHRKPAAGKPAQQAAAPAATEKQPEKQPEQQAANSGTPEVSAIGQLSSGEPSDLRQQTSASIADTERQLKDIKRKLSDQEEKTSAQIREFLKQAKAALNSGDTDGAYTLALKAKVLLGELIQ